jgi:PleD family two-component response regulator
MAVTEPYIKEFNIYLFEIMTKTVRFRTLQKNNFQTMEELKGKFLAIDDNEDILFALKLLLKPYVDKITTLSSPDRVIDLLKVESYDVILLDMNFTKMPAVARKVSIGSKKFWSTIQKQL